MPSIAYYTEICEACRDGTIIIRNGRAQYQTIEVNCHWLSCATVVVVLDEPHGHLQTTYTIQRRWIAWSLHTICGLIMPTIGSPVTLTQPLISFSCCSTHAVSQVCVCVWVFALVCKRNEDDDYYYRRAMNNNSSCDFVASTCCTLWSAPLVWSRKWDALCHQRGGVWRGSVSPRTQWWEEIGIALLLDHICGSTSPLAASATECTYVYDTQVRV